MGKQEAFEIFIRDHEDHLTIEDNKKQLKQRSIEAKRLGGRLNETKDRISELKKQLEMRRRQRAAHGVLENHTEFEEEMDPVEENLRTHIEQETKAYKSTFDRLKAFKTEIEHLKLLLEKAKVKLQRDFQKWWSQEASLLQESEATARSQTSPLTIQPFPRTSTSSESGTIFNTVRDYPAGQDPETERPTHSVQHFRSTTPKRGAPVTAVPAWVDEVARRTVTDYAPSSQLRDLSKTKITPSSIPLTGDKQADANILAFLKAREKLLQRVQVNP